MDSLLKDRLTLIAALGTGVVVGISGIYMYYKSTKVVSRELSHLAGTIENLRREIEQLKISSKQGSSLPVGENQRVSSLTVRSQPHRVSGVSDSAAGAASYTDDPEEEFYDFTDTEEALESWATMNGTTVSSPQVNEAQKFYDELDALLDGSSADKETAYITLTSKTEKLDSDAECLWRLAKASHLLGIVAQNQGDNGRKKSLAYEAFDYAKKALELDKNNPEVHKWYAITIGSLNDYVSTSEKIQNGRIFREHVDKAIELKPDDPTLHHMLGRWTFEVSSLSWIEKKVAATIYSKIPETSLEEALQHFYRCHELRPTWKENMLYIAKSYILEGNYKDAIEWLDSAAALPIQSEDDEIAQSEVEVLQFKYQNYRE